MNKNIYGQVQQALENGQRVNIMTTFSGEEGIIGEGFNKKTYIG